MILFVSLGGRIPFLSIATGVCCQRKADVASKDSVHRVEHSLTLCHAALLCSLEGAAGSVKLYIGFWFYC